MIKKLKYLLLLMIPVITGCNKFVDLKPEDSYIDEQVFSNPASIRQALNSIYDELASNDLYGSNLSMEAVDILGQRYSIGGNQAWSDIANNYGVQGRPGSTFDVLWSSAYTLILNTNNFIAQLEKIKKNNVITAAQSSQLLGEATAIRALMHFDLLRLYAPRYTDNNDDITIPYYTKPDGKVQPLLTFRSAIDSILSDLGRAEIFLANDPIITKGVITSGVVDYYTSFRNRRMNYYAVKALQARANLYFGRKEAAHAAAKAVTDKADQLFPWTNFNAILNNANPDRIFSSEVIMGLNNVNLYNNQNRLFSASLFPTQILAPDEYQLNNAFEWNENDYRYLPSWQNSSHGFRTFFKFADLPDVTKSWRFFQPLIRKSEMYYILAETDPNQLEGVKYLNMVRRNRGLPDLADDVQLGDANGQIEKEYIKEFFGEGQLFFFYKRINSWMVYLPYYYVPLPISETQLR